MTNSQTGSPGLPRLCDVYEHAGIEHKQLYGRRTCSEAWMSTPLSIYEH